MGGGDKFRGYKMDAINQLEEVGGERDTNHVQPHRWKFYWCWNTTTLPPDDSPALAPIAARGKESCIWSFFVKMTQALVEEAVRGESDKSSEADRLAMNIKDRSSKSLCERSMKMVTNIIKLSSFSIANMSLGTSRRPQSSRSHSLSVGHNSQVVDPELLLPRIPGSRRRSQESSKPISYIVERGEGVESTYLILEEKNVDGMASDYINKVHKKNRHYLHETSEDFPIILPPPPRIAK